MGVYLRGPGIGPIRTGVRLSGGCGSNGGCLTFLLFVLFLFFLTWPLLIGQHAPGHPSTTGWVLFACWLLALAAAGFAALCVAGSREAKRRTRGLRRP